ncbi:MAG: CocE/NonD family hydrolase [Bacteroidia bacterium]|nr:CocE/NonD family hydrolase [Bacteroidia bacterium]MDW8158720.1 CocE/NonD family hydrolase [Bacteroidia bacterium]
MKLLKHLLFAGFLSTLSTQTFGQSDPNNGIIDGIDELVTRKEYWFTMKDGVRLATDVFLPVLNDDLAIANLRIPSPIPGGSDIIIPRLKMANKGVQYMRYPNQSDPLKLPVLFTRTPYNKEDPTGGQIYALMGYCGIMQDMRGRYRSEGTYYPMYSDSWDKSAYLGRIGHVVDTTRNHLANYHEDGYDSIVYITDSLRRDTDGDGIITPKDSLICNGSIGMFGASALGNTQYQAAAVRKIDVSKKGLKCLFPIVASGEFYHSTGTHNGVFRERIIDGWLRGQIEPYRYRSHEDNENVWDAKHSLGDYGTPEEIKSSRDVAEKCIDFWTTLNQAHYPDAAFRAVMDISRAYINEKGEPDPNGKISRYTNIDLPVYNLTGWWDIFIDGQIQTWQFLKKYVSSRHKGLQKIVIGPWAHQTIGSRATGDMRKEGDKDYRYPENVGSIIGANLDNLGPDNLGGLSQSEVIDWFRTWLGSPTVFLPTLNEWQAAGNILGQNVFIQVPAADYSISFEDFFNFINGTGPLPNVPIKIKGLGIVDSNTVIRITIPATGNSLIGDKSGAKLRAPGSIEFDERKPKGVANVRFYVVGPVNDDIPENQKVGNYWYSSDTFPLPNVRKVNMYLHKNGTIDLNPPTTDEGILTYLADPDNPVPTHGGPNMIVYTPDNQRLSQGQMNFTDPQYRKLVLDRPKRFINGDSIPDLVSFTSAPLTDTFSIAGFPIATIYAKSNPIDTEVTDTTNCDFIVRVLDVYPDGRELYVFEGAVNARAREYAESWADGQEDPKRKFTNIASDKIYKYRFRMLPIAYTWGKGHRIKVLISSTNHPRYQACPNVPLKDGEFFRRKVGQNKTYEYRGKTLRARKALQGLAFSPQYAANIEFPSLQKNPSSILPPITQNLEATTNVTLYPNPATDVIVTTVEKAGNYTASLINQLGQVVLEQPFESTLHLNVINLPRGIYMLKVSNGLNQATSKKVILR